MMKFLKPEMMYKVGIVGACADAIFALGTWVIGLPPAFSEIFIVAGLCFLFSAVANWSIVKIQNKK